MLRQRGIVLLSLVPYIVGALAVAVAFGATYYKGRVAGRAAATAELQPLLDACKGRERALGTQIESQNEAVAALEAAGKARQAKASAGIAEASKRAKSAQDEAERLRQEAKKAPTGACPAGEAVNEVRRGLGVHK